MVLTLSLAGCYTLGLDHTVASGSEQENLSHGYALLHEVLTQEASANQQARTVPPELQTLLDQISGSALEFDSQLHAFADHDEWIDLEDTGLPSIDTQRRVLDRDERRVDLLRTSGRPFERLLLSTQWQTLTSERNLARALLQIEPDSRRKDFLTTVVARCEELRTSAYKQLDLRYYSVG